MQTLSLVRSKVNTSGISRLRWNGRGKDGSVKRYRRNCLSWRFEMPNPLFHGWHDISLLHEGSTKNDRNDQDILDDKRAVSLIRANSNGKGNDSRAAETFTSRNA